MNNRNNNKTERNNRGRRNPKEQKGGRKKAKLRIVPLGGLNEIGKNITVVEYKDDIVIVDCGMTFPDNDMPGIDIVIPDITYLEKNEHKIRGILLTHGHEDHIGAIPYVLRKISVPIYGTRLTLGLLANKLKEHRLKPTMVEVTPGNKFNLGVFGIDFIRASHSMPDAASIAIDTPRGTILFTGDFKIDFTPIDGVNMDLPKLAEIGTRGVLCLFADSTNVEREGYTMSERTVGEEFKKQFYDAPSRIIVATFASNLHRVQQVIYAAEHFNKKLIISGRSMVNNIEVASRLGYLKIKKDTVIDIHRINDFPPERIVVLTTGSQGEPMSALTRMAHGDHRQVQLNNHDTVIISATPIPGNELTVYDVINRLMEMGVKVVYSAMADIHVSGHACREELKLVHALVRPKFFVPVHGESRHLKIHAELAASMGMPREDILVANNGSVIEFTEDSMEMNETVDAGHVLVDGLGIGDVGNVVLRDRKHLSEDGLIVVVMTANKLSGKIDGPDIISRGFVYVKESEDLMEGMRKSVRSTLDTCEHDRVRDWSTVKNQVRSSLRSYIFGKIKRNPMILPVIIEA